MGGWLDVLVNRWVEKLVGQRLVCFAEALGDGKAHSGNLKNKQRKSKTGSLDVLGVSVAPLGGTWGAQVEPSGTLGGVIWGPFSLPNWTSAVLGSEKVDLRL